MFGPTVQDGLLRRPTAGFDADDRCVELIEYGAFRVDWDEDEMRRWPEEARPYPPQA